MSKTINCPIDSSSVLSGNCKGLFRSYNRFISASYSSTTISPVCGFLVMDLTKLLPMSSRLPIGGSLSSTPKSSQGKSSGWATKKGLSSLNRQIAIWRRIQQRREYWLRRVLEVEGCVGEGRSGCTGE